MGIEVSTYWFDLLVIWLMSIALYVTLYFEALKKIFEASAKVQLRKNKKN